jgi:putative adhesin Stv-like protein
MADKLAGLDRSRISELGKIAYYWAAQPTQFQDNVIISAHGGINRSAKADLAVDARLSLKYYVVHGVVLPDPGYQPFASPTPPVATETVQGSQGETTYNYELSKYQGSHNKAGETYGTIQGASSRGISHNDLLDELFPDGNLPQNVAGRQTLFDVVSIRNRWWTGGSDLKAILALILKHRGKGGIIHCSFCRSYM